MESCVLSSPPWGWGRWQRLWRRLQGWGEEGRSKLGKPPGAWWSFCLPSGDDIGKNGGAKANFSLHRQYWHRQHHNRPVCPSPSEGVQRSAILASHGRLLKGLGHNDLCAGPSWGLQSTVWMVLQSGLRITSLICQGSHFYHSDFGMITYTWICSFVLVRMSTYPFPALLILLVFFFFNIKE